MTREILRELGDGLVLRRATPADAEALAAFNGRIHGRANGEEPSPDVMAWTRDLVARPHPTVEPGDFTIVEDVRTGTIVSTLVLISQTWSYGGVEFGVGRPELVGTDPRYRQQGIVRAQFEVIHRWSAERGQKVQAITGIPYFYRQFGYEMALSLHGGRVGDREAVPRLKQNEVEPYRLRPATDADLPFIAAVYDGSTRRYLVSCVRDQAVWRYELSGRSTANDHTLLLRVIETAAGEPIGFLAHRPALIDGTMLLVMYYEVKAGVSWLAVTPSVLRYLVATGEELAARDGKGPFSTFLLELGLEHPAYHVIRDRRLRANRPYAWYLRVADLPDFLRTVAPVLERRLAESVAVGHTGEIKLGFYRSGVRLRFERGRIVAVEDWKQTSDEISDARFPDLTFLQLLFGYRSLEELEYAFPDCQAPNNEARVLLNAMFPKQPSHVWAIA